MFLFSEVCSELNIDGLRGDIVPWTILLRTFFGERFWAEQIANPPTVRWEIWSAEGVREGNVSNWGKSKAYKAILQQPVSNNKQSLWTKHETHLREYWNIHKHVSSLKLHQYQPIETAFIHYLQIYTNILKLFMRDWKFGCSAAHHQEPPKWWAKMVQKSSSSYWTGYRNQELHQKNSKQTTRRLGIAHKCWFQDQRILPTKGRWRIFTCTWMAEIYGNLMFCKYSSCYGAMNGLYIFMGISCR